MHLYAITRGIKKDVDDFIIQLQGKYLPFKYKATKEGEFKEASVQLSVRPIQLWEFGFPEESKDLVLSTILGGEANKMDEKVNPFYKWIKRMTYPLRKMLGAEPIPKYDASFKMPISRNNLVVLGIGVKKDNPMDNGTEGL